MVLDKVYQPDIYVFGKDEYAPQFLIEVVEDPSLEGIALEHLQKAMAGRRCYRGAIVVAGVIKLIDLEVKAGHQLQAKIVGEVDLSEALKVSARSQQHQYSEENFFVWLKQYAAMGIAFGISEEDQQLLEFRLLPFLYGAEIEFMSLRGNPAAAAF